MIPNLQTSTHEPSKQKTGLTVENYSKGFLVDDEWMGGVVESPPDQAVGFLAFVLDHTKGEYLGVHHFGRLEDALQCLNKMPRSWDFEGVGGCKGGGCGNGKCKGGGCSARAQ